MSFIYANVEAAGISRQEGRPGIAFITAHPKLILFGRAPPRTSGYNSCLGHQRSSPVRGDAYEPQFSQEILGAEDSKNPTRITINGDYSTPIPQTIPLPSLAVEYENQYRTETRVFGRQGVGDKRKLRLSRIF